MPTRHLPKANSSFINRLNKAKVLDLIRKRTTISRAQIVEVNLPGLLLGLAGLGLASLATGLGVVSYRDRLRLRRQRTLLEGASELVQTLINLRGETSCSDNQQPAGG